MSLILKFIHELIKIQTKYIQVPNNSLIIERNLKNSNKNHKH